MSQKQVFLVEDHPMLRQGYRDWLEYGGHQVVLEAASVREALEKLSTVTIGQIDVAVLDGNLTEGDGSGRDGERIAREIRRLLPGVKILCLSLGDYKWPDVMMSKGDVVSHNSANPLGEAVDLL